MWRTTGVSVALPTKPVCQDSHCWRHLDSNTLVMTVADGAGAAPRADIGSDVASRTALDYVVTHTTSEDMADSEFDWSDLVQCAMWAAIEALHSEATRQSVPVEYYATTLIVAVAMPRLVVVAQVGDGMVFVADAEGAIVRLTVPQRGEYSNETTMLTSLYAYNAMQMAVWDYPITGIAAMTDGLLPITTTLPYYKPYFPFFTNLFAFLQKSDDNEDALRKLNGFLLSERVQNGTGDDLTLVLAVPIGTQTIAP